MAANGFILPNCCRRCVPGKFRACFPSVNTPIRNSPNTHSIRDVGFHGNVFSMATQLEGESHGVWSVRVSQYITDTQRYVQCGVESAAAAAAMDSLLRHQAPARQHYVIVTPLELLGTRKLIPAIERRSTALLKMKKLTCNLRSVRRARRGGASVRRSVGRRITYGQRSSWRAGRGVRTARRWHRAGTLLHCCRMNADSTTWRRRRLLSDVLTVTASS